MIKLYIRDISPLFDGEWEKHLELLPYERRCRARRFRTDHDAARCVGAWLLLRDAFAYDGIDMGGLEPEMTEYGKPFLKGYPEFSISHSGEYAAVAVSEESVGVDIEAERCTIEIARRFFAAPEVKAAEALGGSEQREYLQRLWAAKEAFVKAIGTGISTPFDSFCVTLNGPSVKLSQELTGLPIRITDFPVGAYRVAVAGMGSVVKWCIT